MKNTDTSDASSSDKEDSSSAKNVIKEKRDPLKVVKLSKKTIKKDKRYLAFESEQKKRLMSEVPDSET